jgi:hypothetical protein
MPTMITEQVSRPAESAAAQPPDEIAGVFTREIRCPHERRPA